MDSLYFSLLLLNKYNKKKGVFIMADSPKEKKEKESGKYRVINVDKNGNIIPDISKVVVPEELSREIFRIINKERK